MKICTCCGLEKPLDRFSAVKEKHRKIRSQCKDCINIKRKKQARYGMWHRENAEYVKAANRKFGLKRHHGISVEQYDNMLAVQGGVCLICGTHEPAGKGGFKVDHCHSTGAIRGLLCNYCNVGLGQFRDNINILENAILYLKQSKEKKCG